jgi:hypothetical protein
MPAVEEASHQTAYDAALSTLPDYVSYCCESLIFQAHAGGQVEIVSTPFNTLEFRGGVDHEVRHRQARGSIATA